jgi:NADH:ubiquinone oxidoreductase subunit 3 (subunit A)
MDTLLLIPPITFLVLLAFVALQSFGFKILAFRVNKGLPPSGKYKAYACGEDMPENRAQPDYAQFFPFAFFFTIMHVIALVIATVPQGSPVASGMAIAFLAAASVGVYILFRR